MSPVQPKKSSLDDKMSATSFFAALVRQKQGPVVKEKSSSPEPVIIAHHVAEEPRNPEVIILDEDMDICNTPPNIPEDNIGPPVDYVDGSQTLSQQHTLIPSIHAASKQEISNSLYVNQFNNVIPQISAPKLSITRDLPMPPSKIPFDSHVRPLEGFQAFRVLY